MLLQIIQHTPIWVLGLFFGLIALGVVQSQDRWMKQRRIILVPVAMTIFSLFGIYSAFGALPETFGLWCLGAGVACWLGLRGFARSAPFFAPQRQQFFVPGSWFPLVLMMAIFCTKYAVGVLFYLHAPVTQTSAFVLGLSVFYGLLSGLFLGRAVVILQAPTRAA